MRMMISAMELKNGMVASRIGGSGAPGAPLPPRSKGVSVLGCKRFRRPLKAKNKPRSLSGGGGERGGVLRAPGPCLGAYPGIPQGGNPGATGHTVGAVSAVALPVAGDAPGRGTG